MGTFQMWLLHARKGSLYQVMNISDISANLYIPILLGYWQPLTESCTTHARKKWVSIKFCVLNSPYSYNKNDVSQQRSNPKTQGVSPGIYSLQGHICI